MLSALFTIGSIVKINGEDWKVIRYHRIGKRWEVMFRNVQSGYHTSIPLTTLETHVR